MCFTGESEVKAQRQSTPGGGVLLSYLSLYYCDHIYLWDAHLLTGVQEVLHIPSALSHAELWLGKEHILC